MNQIIASILFFTIIALLVIFLITSQLIANKYSKNSKKEK